MLQSFLIALVISIDALAIGISYGIKNIKIKKTALLVINLVSILFLSSSMFLGHIIRQFLTSEITSFISFLILSSLGSYFLMESYIHYLVQKSMKKNQQNIAEIKFSKLKIVVDVAMDCTKADFNVSGDIDGKEALYLGTALSIDSLGVGFGSAMGSISYLQVIAFTCIFNLVAIMAGLTLGKKIKACHPHLNTAWISGSILILLGISKLT